MKELSELDADSILDDEVFIELYEIEDPIERSKRKVQLFMIYVQGKGRAVPTKI